MRDAARLHRRRLHRLVGPRQHAGEGRNADGPVLRHPARRRRSRRRGRHRRAEVALAAARRGGPAVAGGAGVAARARLPADSVQILLDLQFDARRQHRPGRRCAGRRARGRPGDLLPGLPRHRPDRVPGPSLRRGPAAQRKRHGNPPADPDDRPRPAALARPADAPRSRACPRGHRLGRRGGGPVAARRRAARRPAVRGGRRDPRRRPRHPRRCRRGPAARHRRLRHRARPARRLPPPRPPRRCPARMARRAGAGGRAGGLLLAGDARAGRAARRRWRSGPGDRPRGGARRRGHRRRRGGLGAGAARPAAGLLLGRSGGGARRAGAPRARAGRRSGSRPSSPSWPGSWSPAAPPG